MKKKNNLLIATGVMMTLCLTSCQSISETYVKTTDKMGLTPSYAKKNKEALSDDLIAKLPKKLPVTSAPANTPDGLFTVKSSNGRTLKTYVVNGKFDRYVDIYYPNNQLHSHTPLVNGLAEGWSVGYVPDGRVRTKFLYKKGNMVSYIVYDPNGNVANQGDIK